MKKITLNIDTLSPLCFFESSGKGVNYIFKTPVVVNGVRHQVPYIPGNSFRGRIRRKLAQFIMDRWIEQGHAIPVELYVGLNAGAASASNEAANINAKILKAAQDNPYMGLMGGGKYLVRSGIQAGFGFPVCRETVGAGLVDVDEEAIPVIMKDGEYIPASARDLIGRYQSIRKDDLMSMTDPDRARVVIDGGDEAIIEYQASVLEGRKNRKETGGTKEDVSNMMTYEAIVPGAQLQAEINLLPHMTEIHLGALVVALEALAADGRLGGKTASGFGRVRITAELDDEGERIDLIGEEGVTDKGAELLEIGRQALAGLEPEQMKGYFA